MQNNDIAFFASVQGTRKPVLPIHNTEEKTLFHNFMTGNNGFNDPVSGPNWEHAVQLWNAQADVSENIDYKVYFLSVLHLPQF